MNTIPDRLFLQMSGAPGSGKTTLARALAPHLNAVVIDHDVTKSALLAANVPSTVAGGASYTVLHALAQHLLEQRVSVIFDSPCLYQDLLERGQRLAEALGARYRYIECVVDDINELDRRLRTRERQPSQLTGVYVPSTGGSSRGMSGEPLFRHWLEGMKRPDVYLRLDTNQPLDHYLNQAIAYIETGVPQF